MQGSLTLVVFLNIGESHIPSLRGFFSFAVFFLCFVFLPFLDVLLLSFFELFARLLFDSYINRNNWSGFLFFAIPEVFKVLDFAHIEPSTSDNKQLFLQKTTVQMKA